ncbi:MAG: serine acetyltransferase [Proteobacteria bacterium]|nr:serine acetyltransferase [Pseudomonadota bacterium]
MNYSLSAALVYVKSDLFRYSGRISLFLAIKEYFLNRSFKYTFWFRLAKVRSFPMRLIATLMHKRLSGRYGIQIPRVTEIGYGLYIGHHMCIVISSSAKIGNNCNLSQFLTIGSNHGKAATIGNNVYIGPGVSLVEDIIVGDNAIIGAGAVVVKDVIENSTVAGNPARVVSHKLPGRYIKNRWVV